MNNKEKYAEVKTPNILAELLIEKCLPHCHHISNIIEPGIGEGIFYKTFTKSCMIQNHNIKYTNQKSPYLKIIKDSKWQLVNKKQELLDLIDNKCYLLKEKYYDILEKNKYNITKEQLSKIEEFIDKYHEDDKKVMLDLIERTELMLLNNS